MNFLNYAAANYKRLFSSFKQQICEKGLYFDEDIFEDTMLKCNNNLKTKNLNEKEMESYFWKSFKTNTLREANYMRSKTIDNIPENIIVENYNDTTKEACNKITKLIIDKFGYEKYRLFVLHANGATYKEIEINSSIKCAKYLCRKIRDYIKIHYKNGQ